MSTDILIGICVNPSFSSVCIMVKNRLFSSLIKCLDRENGLG